MPFRPYLIIFSILVSSEAVAAFQLLGPTVPLTAQLGGTILLPCSVKTPLPLDELEVDWRRTDSNALVHLFQEGEVRPESQNHAYSGRAHFFSHEVVNGNYSLMLTNVTSDDSGVYMCKVYTNSESDGVTAEITDIERMEVTGPGVASAYVSDGVTLDCTVDTHIQSGSLQVTWKRARPEMLVLHLQNGQMLNSSHERYRGRVEFFMSEIPKGNFSLRLKDVSPEDNGEYICEAHSGQLSGKTTIILQELGVPLVLVLALVMCFLALVSTLGFGIPEFINLTKNGIGNDSPVNGQSDSDSSRATVSQQKCSRKDLIRFSLVLGPNILMFTAFLLCGVTDGFVGEMVACSTVNLSRFLLLFKTAPYLNYLPELLIKFTKKLSMSADYIITAGALYSGVFRKITSLDVSSVYIGVFVGMFPMFFVFFMYGEEGYFAFLFLDILNWSLLWILVIGTTSFELDMFAVTLTVTLIVHILFWLQEKCSEWKWYGYFFWTLFLTLAFPLYSVVHLVYIGQILKENSECAGLICGAALLHTLTAVSGFKHPENDMKKFHIILYICGAVGLPIINCIALATDIFFRSYEGKRGIRDLQVVVLPSECIFVFGWLVFQIQDFWTRERERLKEQLKRACSFKCRKSETISQDPCSGQEMEPLSSIGTRQPQVAEEQTKS